jgi:hypothetical protein
LGRDGPHPHFGIRRGDGAPFAPIPAWRDHQYRRRSPVLCEGMVTIAEGTACGRTSRYCGGSWRRTQLGHDQRPCPIAFWNVKPGNPECSALAGRWTPAAGNLYCRWVLQRGARHASMGPVLTLGVERLSLDFHPRREGAVFLPVQVRPGELSVHPSSYRGGKEGNRVAEALGTSAHPGWVGKSTGRNASEARASLESDVVRADPL